MNRVGLHVAVCVVGQVHNQRRDAQRREQTGEVDIPDHGEDHPAGNEEDNEPWEQEYQLRNCPATWQGGPGFRLVREELAIGLAHRSTLHATNATLHDHITLRHIAAEHQ